MATLNEFIASAGLRMRASPTDSNPHMPGSHRMDHWRCTITGRENRRMVVTFSKGIGHNAKPAELPEVLDCLADDAASVQGTDFAGWCAELGYETDSRKAERTYRVCIRQADSLKRLLGDEAFEALLYDTERM